MTILSVVRLQKSELGTMTMITKTDLPNDGWLAMTVMHCRRQRLADYDLKRLSAEDRQALATRSLDFFEDELEAMLDLARVRRQAGGPPSGGEGGPSMARVRRYGRRSR